MTTIISIIAFIVIMIFINALYVGAEFATVGSRRTRIQQMAANGDKTAVKLLPYLTEHKKLDTYVATCQIGITISSLALAAVGESVVASRLVEKGIIDSPATSSIIVLTLFTILQVILGELLPKSIAVQYPEKVAIAVLSPIQWSQAVLSPIIWICNGSSKFLLRLFGADFVEGHGHVYAPEEIEILVSDSHEGGLLEEDERQYIRNTFRLRDLTAKQVMVHRTKIVSADINTSASDMLHLALDAGYSRIPVYNEVIDEIVGFVHVKDLFRLVVENRQNVVEADAVRSLTEVPEKMSAVRVWEQMELDNNYISLVFDEHGSFVGFITIEDLIEEVFGELQDEFDDEDALMTVSAADGRLHLRADLLVADVNEYLELELPEDGADTIGGLVFQELGRRPEVGDKVVVSELVIVVEEIDDISITSVSIPEQAHIDLKSIREWKEESVS